MHTRVTQRKALARHACSCACLGTHCGALLASRDRVAEPSPMIQPVACQLGGLFGAQPVALTPPHSRTERGRGSHSQAVSHSTANYADYFENPSVTLQFHPLMNSPLRPPPTPPTPSSYPLPPTSPSPLLTSKKTVLWLAYRSLGSMPSKRCGNCTKQQRGPLVGSMRKHMPSRRLRLLFT